MKPIFDFASEYVTGAGGQSVKLTAHLPLLPW